MTNGELLKAACQDAYVAFDKLKSEDFADIKSKLEFCIGSYEFDQNPAGLHEFGEKALGLLKEVKEKSPRKVNKKVIENLEKNL
jgi:hypothetical protein